MPKKTAKKQKTKDQAKPKFFFHWENASSISEEKKAEIKKKTKRRARRHFNGTVVHHRVVSKSESEITFAYNRRTGNKVTIRWRRELNSI